MATRADSHMPGHSEHEQERRTYSNIAIGGNSRSHLGDVHQYNYGHHLSVDDLPSAAQAAFNSSSKQDDPPYLEGTREGVIKRVKAWTYGEEPSSIFWLNGMAGTGKSTVARELARIFYNSGCLGASFFFVRGGGDVSHAGRFFTTIAKQLAYARPSMKEYTSAAVRSDPEIAHKSRQEQWAKLIAEPIDNVNVGAIRPVLVILVDALDECDNDNDMSGIVATLRHAGDIAYARVRVIVTSRPETPIRLGFRSMPDILHQELVLHDVPREIVDADICMFFYEQLNLAKQRLDGLDDGWPDIDKINRLVHLSEGLFIFAATICRYIADMEWDPDDALHSFMPEQPEKEESDKEQRGQGSTLSLDVLYGTILDCALQRLRAPAATDALRDLVGIIAALSEPLTVGSLASLLGEKERDIRRKLERLHSIMRVPSAEDTPVRYLHASFPDFVFDKGRCMRAALHIDGTSSPMEGRQLRSWIDPAKKHTLVECCLLLLLGAVHYLYAAFWDFMLDKGGRCRFWTDPAEKHSILAERCLQLLLQPGILKKDICGLDLPGIRRSDVDLHCVRTCIRNDALYACRYWPTHVIKSGTKLQDDGPVHKFLELHLLHWLEALSWLGRLSMAVTHISDLRSVVQSEKGDRLRLFLSDALRFLLRNRHAVDLAPLQLYESALLFAPYKSILRGVFRHEVTGKVVPLFKMPSGWSAEILKLEGHDDEVNAVAFSPDGRTVASASDDRTVRLWNAQTGEQTQKLEGHDGWVNAVAFSPDGQTVASASGDRTVRLWNVQTGISIHIFQTDYVRKLDFSQNGQSLKTEKGSLDVSAYVPSEGALVPARFTKIGLRDSWITYEDADVLWLPFEYRGTCSAIRDEIIVLGQASGAVTFFRACY